jgi:hypothetical protein
VRIVATRRDAPCGRRARRRARPGLTRRRRRTAMAPEPALG